MSADPSPDHWALRLYVAGQMPRSLRAITNLRRICETSLPGRYEIEVIDLLAEPHRARHDDIVAVPTVVRRLPEPVRRVVGDLSEDQRVITGLQLDAQGACPADRSA
jgi:circadian clock protein KaiB